MKEPKTERKFGSFWTCLNCEGNPEFEHKAMMTHLSDVHGIDTKKSKGTRRMLMHMDGDTWFSWSYEWEIDGKKFVQNTCQKRTGEDAAFWSGE